MSTKEGLFGIEKRWRSLGQSLALTGALAVAGCSSGGSDETSPVTGTAEAPTSAKLVTVKTQLGSNTDSSIKETIPKATLGTNKTSGPVSVAEKVHCDIARVRQGSTPALVFDDLHGGSPQIFVYPGSSDTQVDKEPICFYDSKEVVTAECKTEGRKVHSDPSLGEEDRTSTEWIRFHDNNGLALYATATYVQNPATVLAQLEYCT